MGATKGKNRVDVSFPKSRLEMRLNGAYILSNNVFFFFFRHVNDLMKVERKVISCMWAHSHIHNWTHVTIKQIIKLDFTFKSLPKLGGSHLFWKL